MNHNTRSSSSHTMTCLWIAGSVVCLVAEQRGKRFPAGILFGTNAGVHHQEAVGQHRERQVPMQPVPPPPLVVSEPTLSFGVLVELLYGPPSVRKLRQPPKRRVLRQGGEIVLGLAFYFALLRLL